MRCLDTRILGVTLLFAVTALVATAEETQTTETHVDASGVRVTVAEDANRWGVSVDDWTRYRHLMQGPRGTWSPNLDPLTALGVSADNDPDRRKYAELLVRLEHDRVQHELAFEKTVQAVKRELFPNEAVLDIDKLKSLVHARTKEAPYRAGDRLLVFVALDCTTCNRLIQHLVNDVQSLPGLHLDVFVMGQVRDEAIQAWATKLKLPEPLVKQSRLTLNHDNHTLSRLVRDPMTTVPVLVRARGETLDVLPNDPVVLTRWSESP
jgi:integrating conjugative element protein (TIGR03759 family)